MQLFRLQNEKESGQEVAGMNRTLTNMLIFPHHVSKREVMMWVSEKDRHMIAQLRLYNT